MVVVKVTKTVINHYNDFNCTQSHRKLTTVEFTVEIISVKLNYQSFRKTTARIWNVSRHERRRMDCCKFAFGSQLLLFSE